MVRCAIVGAGHIVDDIHMAAFRALPQVEVVAVCESDEGRARWFQERYRIRRVYPNLDQLLSGPEKIDFVDIATPPHTHYALAKHALEAGLHVLVEKPLGLSVREARGLDEIARARALKLCVLQTYRFRDSVLQARRCLEEGLLGRLYQVTTTSHGDDPFVKRAAWNWDGAGDKLLLYELGIHYIDLAVQFAGPIREIVGFQAVTNPELGATTQIHALVQHENGATGMIDLQVCSSSNFVHFELFGSRQDVLIKFFPEAFRLQRGLVTPLVELRSDWSRLWNFLASTLREKVRAPAVKRRAVPHFRVMKGFLESLARPELEPPVPATSVLATLEALDALHGRLRASGTGYCTVHPQRVE